MKNIHMRNTDVAESDVRDSRIRITVRYVIYIFERSKETNVSKRSWRIKGSKGNLDENLSELCSFMM